MWTKVTVSSVFSLLDQDNYKTLFGVLDNSFLVAYAIGMFFRFVCAVIVKTVLFFNLSYTDPNQFLVFTVGYLASAFLCDTT